MAHLNVWTKTIFFYAIGNTPAVCLTSELPPEQAADILLLGCGDVRNVMYTVYADLGGRKCQSFAYDDFSVKRFIQHRGLSISRVVISIQPY